MLTGFTVGFALFYEVGFVLLLPLVFNIAASARIPLLYVGVPMVAALSVTHGFLPPHPGPTAIASLFHADMGKTLLYGTLLAIRTMILAGPVYAHFLKGIDKPVLEGLYKPENVYRRRNARFCCQHCYLSGASEPNGTARASRNGVASGASLAASR